jgi:hypothetical protein
MSAEEYKYLAIKNWKKYQPQLTGKPAHYFRMYSGRDQDPDYSKLTFYQRYLADAILRLRARFGHNLRNDAVWIASAVCALGVDRHSIRRALGVLVASGFLLLTNQEDDFEKVPIEENIIEENIRTPSSHSKKQNAQKASVHSPMNGELHMCFDAFWSIYPRKVNKQGAMKVWQKISPDKLLQEKIIEGLKNYCANSRAVREKDWEHVLHASTFLNGRRWEDEISEEDSNGWLKRWAEQGEEAQAGEVDGNLRETLSASDSRRTDDGSDSKKPI